MSNLEDCFNSAPHWVDGKQVVSHFQMPKTVLNKQPCDQVEMRKVGVDGGAANGGGGGTKRSAPGHGPAKNRLTITSFLSADHLNLKMNPIEVQSPGHLRWFLTLPF